VAGDKDWTPQSICELDSNVGPYMDWKTDGPFPPLLHIYRFHTLRPSAAMRSTSPAHFERKAFTVDKREIQKPKGRLNDRGNLVTKATCKREI
jgi:hypothetical protein